MKTHFITFLFLIGMSLGISSRLHAQSSYQPGEENLKAREEFQDNKFGIFLHWGLYAMLATGEWTMTNNNLNYKEYAKLAGGFYPSKFDADKWVAAIKASGAKYICLTSRHHDGFSMFDTQYSDFNIVKATPFKRDIIKELAAACSKQGIKLHFYYSHLDWTREDYPWGRTGRGTGRSKPQGDWKSYYQFMNNQLTELLTNYGPVGAIWFDGWWDQDGNPGFNWELPEQYAMIHKLQPGCLIGNNHHQTPFAGEDTQIFERDLHFVRKVLRYFLRAGHVRISECLHRRKESDDGYFLSGSRKECEPVDEYRPSARRRASGSSRTAVEKKWESG